VKESTHQVTMNRWDRAAGTKGSALRDYTVYANFWNLDGVWNYVQWRSWVSSGPWHADL